MSKSNISRDGDTVVIHISFVKYIIGAVVAVLGLLIPTYVQFVQLRTEMVEVAKNQKDIQAKLNDVSLDVAVLKYDIVKKVGKWSLRQSE